jgi:competence transcription factor ComK
MHTLDNENKGMYIMRKRKYIYALKKLKYFLINSSLKFTSSSYNGKKGEDIFGDNSAHTKRGHC